MILRAKNSFSINGTNIYITLILLLLITVAIFIELMKLAWRNYLRRAALLEKIKKQTERARLFTRRLRNSGKLKLYKIRTGSDNDDDPPYTDAEDALLGD